MPNAPQPFWDENAEYGRHEAAQHAGDYGTIIAIRTGEAEAVAHVEEVPGLVEEITKPHHVRMIMGNEYDPPDRR